MKTISLVLNQRKEMRLRKRNRIWKRIEEKLERAPNPSLPFQGKEEVLCARILDHLVLASDIDVIVTEGYSYSKPRLAGWFYRHPIISASLPFWAGSIATFSVLNPGNVPIYWFSFSIISAFTSIFLSLPLFGTVNSAIQRKFCEYCLQAEGETFWDRMRRKHPSGSRLKRIEKGEHLWRTAREQLEMPVGKPKCPRLRELIPHTQNLGKVPIEEGSPIVKEMMEGYLVSKHPISAFFLRHAGLLTGLTFSSAIIVPVVHSSLSNPNQASVLALGTFLMSFPPIVGCTIGDLVVPSHVLRRFESWRREEEPIRPVRGNILTFPSSSCGS